ncbi:MULTISPECIES: YdgA family protein [unclassified Neisseria]|uniref:YdgA family protein n=1 Tax=unclassified Neisseria TaxID=2623750 RepID=UPI001071A41F|nr:MULTISPECIES: YdgA family protein [unclassified Neisseria]MBF0803407.1 YdgA family protein [Neisseria sp. 19428wB4_WF04]TFU43916.1 DUF945 domain-containing protein [Neisseria sp. WF04]
MKKLLISLLLALAAVSAALFGALPYYLGIKAEESLAAQQQLLSQSGFLTIESHQYRRGWFGATETTVVRLKPTLLHNTGKYLPDNIKTVLKEPVKIINHIQHGPFAGSFTPIRAHVETEFQYHPEAAKVLARFFGTQAPVSLTNTVHLSGSGKLSLTVPAFDYEELSGIKLNWQGLSGTTAYQPGFAAYSHDYTAPALLAELAGKGNIALENLRIRTETTDGGNQLALGGSSFKLDKFSMHWKEGFDYHIKINELVNLITDLQIGAFINPTGTVAPSKIAVEKLSFDTQTRENGEWIDSEGRFRFETLVYGDTRYGPLDINVTAEHLDAKSLLAVKNKMAELSSKEMNEEQIQSELLKTARDEASGLFTRNPVLNVKNFTFKTPQGTIDVKGRLGFNGLTQADMDNLSAMLDKTHARFDMQVPQKLLEQLAVSQAGNIFSVNPEDLAEGRASLEDINETLRLMVESTVNSMADGQYLTIDEGNIKTLLELDNGRLKLNGRIFQTAPEPEFTEADMLPETAVSAP